MIEGIDKKLCEVTQLNFSVMSGCGSKKDTAASWYAQWHVKEVSWTGC